MTGDKEELENNIRYSYDKDVILTIDQNGKIIKINNECEKISGYNQEEILYQNFFDVLIPQRYTNQWKNIMNSLCENNLINDFNLPLLTSRGQEVMISWSSFPVANQEGKVEHIGLVGQIVFTCNDSNEPQRNIEYEDNNSKYMANYFNEFEKTLKELENKNNELEKKNKKLERKIEKLKSNKSVHTDTEDIVGRGSYRFSNVFRGLKKREEIGAWMLELDEREKRLNRLEKKLEKEKHKINETKNNFVQWREKLEELESDIQSRKKWVVNKERALKKLTPTNPENVPCTKIDTLEETDKVMINELEDCAAIVQRGVFKIVNYSFADLLGYKTSEIVEKSIFDFIDPSGFSGIEKYYFNRLKGDDTSSFETIFSTNDNVKISVEVNTKPTFYNGEKAEVIVFKKLKLKKD